MSAETKNEATTAAIVTLEKERNESGWKHVCAVINVTGLSEGNPTVTLPSGLFGLGKFKALRPYPMRDHFSVVVSERKEREITLTFDCFPDGDVFVDIDTWGT